MNILKTIERLQQLHDDNEGIELRRFIESGDTLPDLLECLKEAIFEISTMYKHHSTDEWPKNHPFIEKWCSEEEK